MEQTLETWRNVLFFVFHDAESGDSPLGFGGAQFSGIHSYLHWMITYPKTKIESNPKRFTPSKRKSIFQTSIILYCVAC